MTVLYMTDRPPVLESRQEDHDRRECVALDGKVTGANRELAQWLLDHPVYSAAEVAKWLNCGDSRIKGLRRWAQGGFAETPFSRSLRRPVAGDTLKTNDNFEDDDFEPSNEVEDPAKILTNILDTINHAKGVAEAYRKILKVSPFDREAKVEIYNAINKLIVKWRTVQSTLDTKGHGNDKG
jgi:hypothetical protein